ncbi:MAG: hypothetical protein COB02_06235 [Candidatus Cloacimonadota bacterium]|nr:MAG: hypothetical protein COB02_06235 [Candidatus Cloacimonadota bacterium]
MNKIILYFILLSYFTVLSLIAIPLTKTEAINQIKIRNGDIYILVNPDPTSGITSSSAYGLWRFYRGKDYPDDTKYKREKMSGFPSGDGTYSGLTVDKFAKVYVFKEKADATPTSIVTLTNKHPDFGSGGNLTMVNTNNTKMKVGTGCAALKAVKGSPPGWVYVITDNGKEGWVELYNTTAHGSLGPVVTLSEKAGVLNSIKAAGGTILPPAFKSSAANFYYTAHGGFWTGKRSNPTHGIEIAGSTGSPGRVASGAPFCGNPAEAKGGMRYPEWAYVAPGSTGSPCGSKLYPSLGAFFMTPARSTHAADGGKGTNLAATRVCSVEKEVRQLFFDRYISGLDHDILRDSKTSLGLDNEDLFPSPPTLANSGKLIFGTSPVSVSVGSLTAYARYNHCGDMCGAPGQSAPPVRTSPGKAVGAMSSFGTKDSQQRKYILKSSSAGGSIETWVMRIDGNGSSTALVRTALVKRDNGTFDYNGVTGADFNPETDAIGSRFGASQYIGFRDTGSGIGHISSIQVSKRSPDKDWVYTSNPVNSQFFRVSESFWGTGGIQWILRDPNNATIDWLQVNHETGIRISEGTMPVNNVASVVAFGVDGDGKVYWLEKSFQENLNQLTEKLGGTNPTWDKIFNSGKLISPTSTPTLKPLSGESEVPILITVSRDTGLGLFKSAIGVATPFFIGTLPTGGVGCQRTFLSRSADPSKPGRWGDDWSGQFCNTPDNTLAVDVEMAVINVANPPLSEGKFSLDIVDVPEVLEGQKVVFYMENPPKFNGQKAQLAGAGGIAPIMPYDCSAGTVLRSFSESTVAGAFDGYVRMVSNESKTGSRPVLDQLKLLPEPRNGGVQTVTGKAWTYEDSDNGGNFGQNLPSFIYEKIPNPLINFGNCAGGFPIKSIGPDVKTLRYRWMVKALTPPMSRKKNHPNLLGLPNQCENPTTDPSFIEPMLKEIPGLIFASCYKDVPLHSDLAMAAEFQTEVKSPEIEFPDPGSYEVILELIGLRWNADGLTFDDESTGVTYEVTKAVASYIVNVHPMQAQVDGSVSDIHIMNNFAAFTNTNTTWNGTPIVDNIVSSNSAHLEVIEDTAFPLVAEVTIDFYRAPSKEYIDGVSNQTMKKYDGVGVWDYSYPGIVHNKLLSHPMNFATSGINNGAGNDGTANYDTSPVIDELGGGVLAPPRYLTGADSKLSHIQGTYSLDDYYTDGVGGASPNGLVNTYESMFDWYEIKYYWFYRYKNAITGERTKPKLFRKGNLSEIWAIQNLASVNGIKKIIPDELQSTSTGWNEGELIKVLDADRRTYKVRIPLFQDRLLSGPQSIEDQVVNWAALSNSANPDFSSLTPVNVIKNGVNLIDTQLGLYSFKVPSEPTSIEFSFYIDYPTVKWSKRNRQDHILSGINVNETVSSDIANETGSTDTATLLGNLDLNATYYDLVPWGPRSQAAADIDQSLIGIPNISDATRSFGGGDPRMIATNQSGWGNLGAYKAYGAGFYEDDLLSGGLEYNGDYTREKTDKNDNWFDVIVLDNTPPSISYVNDVASIPTLTSGYNTFNFGSEVGGMWDNGDGIVLSVIDNNPFQHWKDYKAFDTTTPDVELFTPYLQQFYYDLGPSPKNMLGLGLMDNNSTPEPCVWGYSIANPLSPSDGEGGTATSWLSPFGQNQDVFTSKVVDYTKCNFRHPYSSLSFDDQAFVKHDTPDFNVTNILEGGAVNFTPPNTLLKGSIFDGSGVNPVDNSYYAMQFRPKVDNSLADYGGDSNGEIRFLSDPGNYDALDGSSVNFSYQTTSFFNNFFDRTTAYRTAFYWIPKDALISPYFLGASSNGIETYKAYARAYDVSRRYGGLAREDVGTVTGTIDQKPDLKSTEVGTYRVHDNVAPNLKVTFFDYKQNSLFKFLIVADASHHQKQGQAGEFSSNAILMKSKDQRGTYYQKIGDQSQTDYSSGRLAITTDFDLAHPSTISGLAAYGTNASGLGNFLVKIPEDVRFKIKVEAVDNVTLPENIQIEIQSDTSGFSLGSLVETENPFLAKVTTVRNYQSQGFISNFWQYPQPGRYDVIKITISDQQGNRRMVKFPIEVIPQDLHFRKLGDSTRIK